MADSELSEKLSRQQKINEGEAKPVKVSQSVYAEFKEFSIPEIKEFRKTFVKLVSCAKLIASDCKPPAFLTETILVYIYVYNIYTYFVYM